MNELELYIHIPFCMKKCEYCDFLSYAASNNEVYVYFRRLLKEIAYYGPYLTDYEVQTIFIGGGTPTMLEGYHIKELMSTIREHFHIAENAEITMECNPGTLNKVKMSMMAESGINRISLGLQSADDRELEMLGRIHNYEMFLESFDLARKAGIRNVNVDVMFGLPGQSITSWERTLKKVMALHPEHISAYSLMIEEGTPFYEKYKEDLVLQERGEMPYYLPTEDEEREMYEATEEMLAKKSYFRYEISNYARPGKECRHNVGYWERKNYMGFGLGAASLLENVRFKNTSDLHTYLNEPFDHVGEQIIDRKGQMEEFMFLGLRMADGVSRQDFEKMFGVPIENIYGPTILKLQRRKLLAASEGHIFLTPTGVSLSNRVLAEFLLDEPEE